MASAKPKVPEACADNLGMKNVIPFPFDLDMLEERRTAASSAAEAVDTSAAKAELPEYDDVLDDFIRDMLIEVGEDPDDDSFETFEACIERLAAREKRD
jgi:hypothetical protein